MNTKDEDICIKAVRDGLREGFTNLTPEMEKLFRLVYRMGYKQCTIDLMEKQNLNYTDIASDGGMDPRT